VGVKDIVVERVRGIEPGRFAMVLFAAMETCFARKGTAAIVTTWVVRIVTAVTVPLEAVTVPLEAVTVPLEAFVAGTVTWMAGIVAATAGIVMATIEATAGGIAMMTVETIDWRVALDAEPPTAGPPIPRPVEGIVSEPQIGDAD